MSYSECSVIKSDVIKRFDCNQIEKSPSPLDKNAKLKINFLIFNFQPYVVGAQ